MASPKATPKRTPNKKRKVDEDSDGGIPASQVSQEGNKNEESEEEEEAKEEDEEREAKEDKGVGASDKAKAKAKPRAKPKAKTTGKKKNKGLKKPASKNGGRGLAEQNQEEKKKTSSLRDKAQEWVKKAAEGEGPPKGFCSPCLSNMFVHVNLLKHCLSNIQQNLFRSACLGNIASDSVSKEKCNQCIPFYLLRLTAQKCLSNITSCVHVP